jgi:hypothetical protein
VIKFHEYKGPPNVVKSTNPTTTPTPVQPDKNETPYHILLQQQQLFLQWQLEFNGSPPINVNNLDKLQVYLCLAVLVADRWEMLMMERLLVAATLSAPMGLQTLMESQYFLVMPTVVDREWSVKLRYESD